MVDNYGQASVPLHPYVKADSFHINQFNDFVLEMYSCGLMDKWNKGMSIGNVSKKVIEIIQASPNKNELDLMDFLYPLIAYWCGISISILFALAECTCIRKR